MRVLYVKNSFEVNSLIFKLVDSIKRCIFFVWLNMWLNEFLKKKRLVEYLNLGVFVGELINLKKNDTFKLVISKYI